MRIVYFVQYFNLPHEPGGSRAYQFARAWVRAGHDVTIVTGAVNHKTLSVPGKYRGRLYVREEVDGIRIVRAWSYAGIRGSFRRRLLNFLSFAATAAGAGLLAAGRPDVVYASSTPLTVGLPGLATSVLRRATFFFELRDLWPESAVVAGVLDGRSRATRAAYALARLLYRRAARCVAVTRGIADGLAAAGVPREKILFVPNGVDDWMVGDLGPPPAPAPGAGPPAGAAAFKVVYVGAHGRWNGLPQILDAAALLRDRADISFVFAGDGDERERLVARARELGLTRMTFLGAIPKREAFDLLRGGSASIVATWSHEFQKMVLANKIFDYLAAGRPVVAAAHGEMAELIAEAGCGVVTPPEQPAALAGAIRRLADTAAADRERMGAAGREYILRHYRRTDLAARLLAAFHEATGTAPADTR
jgi:glycosyltransferase involved in cell wall biosynthesis